MRWVGSARKVRLEAIALMCLRLPLLSSSSSMPNSPAISLTNASELVDVELIDDEVDDEDPAGAGVGGDGLLDVGGEVLVGASLSYGGSYDLAGSHLEVGDQTLGAVAFVLVLLALAASLARLRIRRAGWSLSRAWMPVFSSVLIRCTPSSCSCCASA